MSAAAPARPMARAQSHNASASASAHAVIPLSSRVAMSPIKARRAELARLKVTADICPQVFMRTLGLIAQRDIVPLSMSFEQRRTRLHFEIEIGGLTPQGADILVAKVEQQVRVRSARLVWFRRR